MGLEDKLVQLQIWDTAGQERYQSLGPGFYRGADALVIVFDVTNKKSFTKLEQWRLNFLHQADPANPDTFPIIVMGNKVDKDERVVDNATAEAWCKSKGISPSDYFETSAKEAINVEQAFQAVARLAIERGATDDVEFDPGVIDMHDKSAAPAEGGCPCGKFPPPCL